MNPQGLSLDADLAVAFAPFAGTSCLVTGGLGFIGSNLVRALAQAGARVHVIDSLVPQHGGDRRNLEGFGQEVPVHIAPIWDPSIVEPIVHEVQYIFNVAGQVSHLESMTFPTRDLELNLRSHVGFLEIVRRVNPAAVVVYTSTRQVYGRPRYLPVDEEHATNPLDVNGVDKLACEQYHLLYARAHGMNITALRLTNVYGPRQNLQKDGLGFLPVFIRHALLGEEISLYGDGSQTRDCLHVNDVVRALALAVVNPDSRGEVFNLGHPQMMSLREIARELARVCDGVSVHVTEWPAELTGIDIGSFQGDYSKAKRILGWEPYIEFVDGIAETLAFYREHPWYLSST